METLPASARRFVLAVVVSGWTALAVTLGASAGTVLSPRGAALCVVLSLLVLAAELRPITIVRGDMRD